MVGKCLSSKKAPVSAQLCHKHTVTGPTRADVTEPGFIYDKWESSQGGFSQALRRSSLGGNQQVGEKECTWGRGSPWSPRSGHIFTLDLRRDFLSLVFTCSMGLDLDYKHLMAMSRAISWRIISIALGEDPLYCLPLNCYSGVCCSLQNMALWLPVELLVALYCGDKYATVDPW